MRNANETRATFAHVAPFVSWVFISLLPGLPPAWNYLLRTVVCLALLAWLRPWVYYPALQKRFIPLALACGAAVLLIWVVAETAWFGRLWPGLQAFYLRYGVGLASFGSLPAPAALAPYAPVACGWPLTVVRILGSALAIAVAEEFFWRGFLFRALSGERFLTVNPGIAAPARFLLVAVCFGLEHERWLVGIAAGIIYGLLYVRTRDIWAACLAHATTNFLLGCYVVMARAYPFWA